MRDDTVDRCPSELELDRWALAGRPTGHRVPEHALGCPACASRLAAMEHAERVVAPAVFEQNVQDVLDRVEARRVERRRPWAWLFEAQARWALATVAAACLVLVLAHREPPLHDPVTATWKAGEGVALQVLAGGEPSAAGATLAPGVVLTMRLTVTRPGHLALVSLEQGGRVSRVLPAKGARPTPVTPGVVVTQGGVAPATGVERLVVLFDERPFDLDAALRDVQTASWGDLAAAKGSSVRLDPARDQGPRVVATWWFRHAGGQP